MAKVTVCLLSLPQSFCCAKIRLPRQRELRIKQSATLFNRVLPPFERKIPPQCGGNVRRTKGDGSLSSRAEACLCRNVISDLTEGASPFPTFDKQIYGEKNNVILSETKDLKPRKDSSLTLRMALNLLRIM